MNDILKQVRTALNDCGDPTRRESTRHFFKEEVLCYGVPAATVKSIAKKALKGMKGLSKENIFELCEELWKSDMIEECGVACEWSYALRKQYVPADLAVFENWVDRYVHNWAACDTLCNHTVGGLIEMYPEQGAIVQNWADSGNRWKRRAAAVSFIVPARKGLFLPEIFAVAEHLLIDEDDMVQKGYGWMLKAASQAHAQPVFDFLMERKTRMPRTAFRYALEKMPADWRKRAMQK